VQFVGGTEFNLGLIVGVTTIGGVIVRVIQGFAIDRFGSQLIWISSLIIQVVALLWHLKIDSATSLEVFLARGLYAMGLAGSFGAWFSFVSLQAPQERIAEIIGVVGASGFIGMAIGPVIGDQIFADGNIGQRQISSMFIVAAEMTSVSLLFSMVACLSAGRLMMSKDHAHIRMNLWNLLRVRRPGLILVVGMLMGLIIGFPGTYLRPFAESLDINEIKTFFLVYNITAFVARMIFRRAPQVLGLKKTISLGLAFFFVSIALYLTVTTKNGFWLPAIIGGLGHSFLFPSVVAACTSLFHKQERGLATNLILAMYDLGIFVGMPIIGKVLIAAPSFQLPPYPAALMLICTTIATITVLFYWRGKT